MTEDISIPDVPDAGSLEDDSSYLGEGSDGVESSDSEDTGLDSTEEPAESGTEDTEETEETEEEKPESDKTEEAEKPETVQVKALSEQLQKYEEVFASPEEAAETVRQVEFYNNLDRAIMDGRVDVLLTTVAETNPESAVNFAKNFLPTLQKMSKETYLEVTAPVIRDVLRFTLNAAKSQGNQNLINSLVHISKFLFDSTEIPAEVVKTVDPERVKLQAEKAQLLKQQDDDFKSAIGTAIVNQADIEISKNLDPNNVMSETLKSTVIEKTKERVAAMIEADKVFQKKMNTAIANGLRTKSREAAISALRLYMGKFNALMPACRAGVIKEIMPKSKSGNSKASSTGKVIAGPGKAPNKNTPTGGSRKVDWSKTSDADYLNDKVTYR